MLPQVHVGVDVARDWLDVHHPAEGARRLANTPEAVRAFAGTSAETAVHVVFEATGGYDRWLAEALAAAGVGFSRVNPRQARDFAKAMGVLGKTDKVPTPCGRPHGDPGEARLLAEFGRRLTPPATALPDAGRRALQAQAARRRPLVEMRKEEATQLQQTADGEARSDIESHLCDLDRRIAAIEEQMARSIQADPDLAPVERRLRTVPGVGPIVARTLITELPELGRPDRRAICVLAGLAPVARDGGHHTGRRSIRGGRPIVRTLLDLAALHASHHDATFAAFRRKLQEAGQPAKVAIVATARKLLTVLNAMLATGADYRAASVAGTA